MPLDAAAAFTTLRARVATELAWQRRRRRRPRRSFARFACVNSTSQNPLLTRNYSNPTNDLPLIEPEDTSIFVYCISAHVAADILASTDGDLDAAEVELQHCKADHSAHTHTQTPLYSTRRHRRRLLSSRNRLLVGSSATLQVFARRLTCLGPLLASCPCPRRSPASDLSRPAKPPIVCLVRLAPRELPRSPGRRLNARLSVYLLVRLLIVCLLLAACSPMLSTGPLSFSSTS